MCVFMVYLVVCNLEEEIVEDIKEGKELLFLFDSVFFFGDILIIVVCGLLYYMSVFLVGIKFLNGSFFIKKDFYLVFFLDKCGMERFGVIWLFEFDDEEEDDFIGFNVLYFDRLFLFEGDLSCKINFIVESMDGDVS